MAVPVPRVSWSPAPRPRGTSPSRAFVFLLAALVFALAPAGPSAQPQPADTCVTCHLQSGDERLGTPARDFASDVHQSRGFTCADCHGGDPRKAGTDAMDPAKGFIGVPPRQQIPALCGKCHSNADFMKRYNPQLRIDQVTEYRTSVHGQRLFTLNDPKVAVCSNCHTAHSILPASDGRSTVYPLHVAETCARCHANAQYMAGYNIPTDQYAKYTASIHWTTLSKVGDLSAPSCNDCHGNHGAVPPGVTSVANVCGQCHSVQADHLEHSPHQPVFQAMGVAGCPTCHQNHEIHPPSDQMLGAVAPAVCASCHDPSDAGGKTALAMRGLIDSLRAAHEQAAEILGRAARAGMEVSQPEFDLNGVRTDLVEARLAVHTFDAGRVRTPVDQGLAVARKAYEAGVQALAELRFRRDGLAVSLVIIVLVLAGLILKIRQIERRAGGGRAWHSIETHDGRTD
jgi:predicted CXXCH cytochrome family protein